MRLMILIAIVWVIAVALGYLAQTVMENGGLERVVTCIWKGKEACQ